MCPSQGPCVPSTTSPPLGGDISIIVRTPMAPKSYSKPSANSHLAQRTATDVGRYTTHHLKCSYVRQNLVRRRNKCSRPDNLRRLNPFLRRRHVLIAIWQLSTSWGRLKSKGCFYRRFLFLDSLNLEQWPKSGTRGSPMAKTGYPFPG